MNRIDLAGNVEEEGSLSPSPPFLLPSPLSRFLAGTGRGRTKICLILTLNFLVAVVNTLNNKTHCTKEMAEFSFEKQMLKAFVECKQRLKSKLSLFPECVLTKLCEPCTSFTSHLHSWCGMVWYRMLRVKPFPPDRGYIRGSRVIALFMS